MPSSQIVGLRAALQVTPNNPVLRLLLANALIEENLPDEAINEYEIIATNDVNNFEAYLGLGKTLLSLGRASDAKVALAHAIKLNESHGEAHMLYSHALSASGELGEAWIYQGIALKLDPSQKVMVRNTVHGDSSEHQHSGSNVATSERSTVTFRDVGGMERVKERIRRSIVYPLQKPELYKAYNKKVGGGLLLYGPPGCGKTYIARATAGEVKANFIYVGLNDVLDLWLGESERKLHAIFESARRQTPTVLFFDEVDAIGNSRTNLRQSAGRNLVNQFLSELDGINSNNEGLLVLAATNAPWDIDSALRRPGRFDHIVFVEPPDEVARRAILDLHMRGKPHAGVDTQRIALETEGFSGADLMSIVETASEIALNEAFKLDTLRLITTADLVEAKKSVKPSISEWLDAARNYVKYSNQSGTYDDVADYLKRIGRI